MTAEVESTALEAQAVALNFNLLPRDLSRLPFVEARTLFTVCFCSGALQNAAMSKRTSRRLPVSSPTLPPRRLSLSPDARGGFAPVPPPAPDAVRALYGPAKTLGASEEVRAAMDSRLEASGVYSLLQHTLETGMGAAPQFMGYGALQNLAQNGLVRACVETVSDDMTRAWIELKREGEGGDDALPSELAQACKKYGLQRVFHEAVELVGYEGGAFVFIDTGAVGPELERPLNVGPYSAELQPGGALRFAVVDPVNVFPGDYDSLSPLEPDYFRPRWWWVLGQRVHASRLIRLVANECPVLLRPAYNFLGIPQAQILWDYVLHFQECRAAEARLLTKFSLTVFKTKMDDILFASGGTAQLDARIRYMIQSMNNDGVLAVDKEAEEVVKLETPLSGVTDIVRQSLEILAAMNRTPAVKLLGISPSGFNATGESDIRNYYDHITSQQEKVLRDGVKKALDCLQLHLRGSVDRSVTFDFAPLGEEDRAALATLQKTKADTIAVYLDRNVIDEEEAREALAADPDSGFSNIDPADVPEPDEGGMGGMFPEGGEGGDLDDADKAGAVLDLARDEEVWRTAENGKRFQIDTETGEILKGNVGQPVVNRESRPVESTRPDSARYEALLQENGGDHKKAAHAYFREKLQGRHVTARTDEGPIEACFTGGGWGELKKGMRDDPLKAALVPHLPDIVANGTYSVDTPAHNHPDVRKFHSYAKSIHTEQGDFEAIVDVAERPKKQPQHQVYSLTREGTREYEYRRQKESASSPATPGQNRGARKTPTHGSDAAFAKNIAPFFEVVNIRFVGEGAADA